jgi:biotin synthase
MGNIHANYTLRLPLGRFTCYPPRMGYFPTALDLTLSGSDQTTFHEQAACATREFFGRRVFVRAVVEVSNYCRENCHYCGMRRENLSLSRARADFEELAEILLHHRPEMVTDINIQTGEDPVAAREVVLPLIQILRRETRLGISVGLGTHDYSVYQELKEAGASIYILKYETADALDYRRKEAPGSLAERVKHIRWLAAQGWHVSSGFIAGLPGQLVSHLVENYRLADQLPLRGCSVSPFVPGSDTPLAAAQPSDVETTLNCMAALRLMRAQWVIPAVSALNLARGNNESGYRRGLRAGANLVTINMTPQPLQKFYPIYRRDRFIMDEATVMEALAAEDLVPSQESLVAFCRQDAAETITGPETVVSN